MSIPYSNTIAGAIGCISKDIALRTGDTCNEVYKHLCNNYPLEPKQMNDYSKVIDSYYAKQSWSDNKPHFLEHRPKPDRECGMCYRNARYERSQTGNHIIIGMEICSPTSYYTTATPHAYNITKKGERYDTHKSSNNYMVLDILKSYSDVSKFYADMKEYPDDKNMMYRKWGTASFAYYKNNIYIYDYDIKGILMNETKPISLKDIVALPPTET